MSKRKVPFYLSRFQQKDFDDAIKLMKSYSINSEDFEYLDMKERSDVLRFEEKILDVSGARHVLAVPSSISALLIALQALEIKRNHRVICSVYCHPFIPACIRYFDAEPIFVDIDPKTLAMLPEQCEELLKHKERDRIKAVIVSHIGGVLADMEPFYRMKEEYQVALIEDLSSSLGLKYEDGRCVGTGLQTDFAITSCFSGFSPKIFNVGAIFTGNGELAKKCQSLRNQSLIRDRSYHGLFYDVIDVSLDHRLSPFATVLGSNALDALQLDIAGRIEIANIYHEGLKDLEGVRTIAQRPTNIYSLFMVFFEKERDRISSLLYEAGIETELHFVPINFLSYYKNKYALKTLQFSNAYQIYQEVLSLPIYAWMKKEDAQYVVDTIRDIISRGGGGII